MCPEIFRIGSIAVHGYGFCIAIGVLIAYFISEARIKKMKSWGNIWRSGVM